MGKKKLGKITDAQFGKVHDNDFLFGLKLDFGGAGWGVSTHKYLMNISGDCKWKNSEERMKVMDNIMLETYDLLQQSKVNDVSGLIGIPVEVEFDCEEKDSSWGSRIIDFRILKEVL